MKYFGKLLLIFLAMTSCGKYDAQEDKLVLVKRYFTVGDIECKDTLYIKKSRYTDTLSAHFSDSMHLKYESFDGYPVYKLMFYPRSPLGKIKIFVIDSVRKTTFHVREMYPHRNGGRFIYLDGKRLTHEGTLSYEYLFICDTSNDASLVGKIKINTKNVTKLDSNTEYIFYK